MPSNLRQDLSKGNYRAVIPVAVDGMALVERPNPETGNGGTAFVDTVTLVDETGNILGTSGNPVYVSGGTGPGGTSSANAIANASTQSFASGSSNFLQADLTGALKVNVVAGGGSSSTSAIANAATQSFANGTANSLQADTTGALKVNVIATVGGGGGGGSANAIANASTQSFAPDSSNFLQADLTGALKVNVVAGGSSAANIGVLGSTAPTSGNYISFANSGGILTGVTSSTQLPVASYTSTKQVQINPTNTIGSGYSTGNCIGGKLTFPNVTRVNSGIIQSITIVSKTSNSVGYKLYIFSSNPINSTFTDKTNPSINALDLPFLIDQFAINAYDNGLGTMTIYPFDNVGRSFYSTDNSLYAILVPTAGVTYTSTTNLFITMSVMED